MKLTLTHTTTGWFAGSKGAAWFHHRKPDEDAVEFATVCLPDDVHRALGLPDTITITIEAAE